MNHESEEGDYLVAAQPELDPTSLRAVVREVFLLEHGCVTDLQISEVIDFDKTRLSQIFTETDTTEARSIDRLLEPLSSLTNKRRIIRAWSRGRFGVDPGGVPRAPEISGPVTEKTLRRIDRQIREMRLSVAVETTSDALRKCDDLILKEQLFDRAFMLRQRLDRVGSAVTVARAIALRAKERQELPRLAMAHLLRIRALLGLADARPEEIEPIFRDVSELIASLPPAASPLPPYLTADAGKLASLRLNARISFAERGVETIERSELQEVLAVCIARAKGRVKKQTRFGMLQLAARIYLLLGETTPALELLEQSFEKGGEKQVHRFEMTGLLYGRILRATEGARPALSYLRGVRATCATSSDHYHERLADYDIARLENAIFPPLRTGSRE